MKLVSVNIIVFLFIMILTFSLQLNAQNEDLSVLKRWYKWTDKENLLLILSSLESLS